MAILPGKYLPLKTKGIAIPLTQLPQSTMPVAPGKLNTVNEALRNEARAEADLQFKAEDEYKRLKTLSPEEAAQEFSKIKTEDKFLADKIQNILVKESKGLTSEEKKILDLGVKNGARANFIYQQIQSLPTPEEKAQRYSELKNKGVISELVEQQIMLRLSQ